MTYFKPFTLPVPPEFPARDFDIRDYGATPGGNASEAIRAAIDACSTAGGGRVVIPAGEWHTGPIHLKSGVNLHAAAGAYVHFSTDFYDYLPVVYGTPSRIFYMPIAAGISPSPARAPLMVMARRGGT